MVKERTRAQESSAAIEKLYVTMRHLFNRGFYKPSGISGFALKNGLLSLRPEIYGSIADPDKVELDGLVYVIDRLPEGIEECRFINLTSDEGFSKSHFEVIYPSKRRRNCYRIDNEQMNIEITRGRSEIYDILTHLTFLFHEAEKIRKRAVVNKEGKTIREWNKIEDIVLNNKKLSGKHREIALTHLASLLGRSFEEVLNTYQELATKDKPERFIHIMYWLGKLSIDEVLEDKKREISFNAILRESIGHHLHGELWSNAIKKELIKRNLFNRPIHVISANMHSVMNLLYSRKALPAIAKNTKGIDFFVELSKDKNSDYRSKVKDLALKSGMYYIEDKSGSNINVQIFDTAKVDFSNVPCDCNASDKKNAPVFIVMDYAFGEQAFEAMDELLKPYKDSEGSKHLMNIKSISIMGKAGILEGGKGDIMIPDAHIFEGTADNYPFENSLKVEDFKDSGLGVYSGPMISVLGTSLQNKDILRFFNKSSWEVIGLEMEGAHYQKAIQAASKIRKSIAEDVKLRYAYYASDNPLETGSTLASGGLGHQGVLPTYKITEKILEQIFSQE
ncbi:MAG: hypothetical protein ABFR62_05920 [Bacteroidota bacterium]